MKRYGRKLTAVLLSAALAFGGATVLPNLSETAVVEAAKKVSISKTKLSLEVGKKATLKMKNTKKKVTWKTNKKAVATVSKKGVVTAKKKGTATITATVAGKKYKCKVTVKALPAVEVYGADGIAIGAVGYVSANNARSAVTWKSSNPDIIEIVRVDKKNHEAAIRAKAVGKATITATCKNQKVGKITVEALERTFWIDTIDYDTSGTGVSAYYLAMDGGAAYPSTGTLLGYSNLENVSDKATWTSDNESVVTVSASITGAVITPKSVGNAYVIGTYNGVTQAVKVVVMQNGETYAEYPYTTNVGLEAPEMLGYAEISKEYIGYADEDTGEPYFNEIYMGTMYYNGEELTEEECEKIEWSVSNPGVSEITWVTQYGYENVTAKSVYTHNIGVIPKSVGTTYVVGKYKDAEYKLLVIVQ